MEKWEMYAEDLDSELLSDMYDLYDLLSNMIRKEKELKRIEKENDYDSIHHLNDMLKEMRKLKKKVYKWADMKSDAENGIV